MNRRAVRKKALELARKMAEKSWPSDKIYYMELVTDPKMLTIKFTVTSQGTQ